MTGRDHTRVPPACKAAPAGSPPEPGREGPRPRHRPEHLLADRPGGPQAEPRMNEDGATPNDVPRGILAICAGLAFLTLNDAIAKLLTERHDPVQILFLRNLIAVPMIAAAALFLHGPRALTTRRPGLHAVRGLTMLAGVWFYFA